MQGIEITLTSEEMEHAVEIGMSRYSKAKDIGIASGVIFGALIDQAAAELAIADLLRICGPQAYLPPEEYEVRYGTCVVTDEDVEELIIFNVTGQAPTFRINGWMRGDDVTLPVCGQIAITDPGKLRGSAPRTVPSDDVLVAPGAYEERVLHLNAELDHNDL